MSDLSELFEQLADGPVLLATAFDSVNADYDNGTVALYGAPRYGRDNERATRRIVARPARKAA